MIKKLFLEVKDVLKVAQDLESSLFVPTLMHAHLGDAVELVLRLPKSRALTVPVSVVGRRLRAGGPLMPGLFVVCTDEHTPLLETLHELGSGRLVDFETRLQEHMRRPARVTYLSREDAQSDLLGLLGDDGAVLDVGGSYSRNDRVSLQVVVEHDVILEADVLVRRMHSQDGVPSIVCVALDGAARQRIGAFLNDEDELGLQLFQQHA